MVTAAVPIAIDPSADPTHGRRERLTGRVLDPDGTGGATGLLVVIWGISPTRAEVDAFPLLIAETTIGGYFADAWPSMELAQAWAVLGGRDKVPVPLDRNRLPHKVVLVTAKATERPEPENDAECPGKTPSPPRAPDAVDIAANPAAFAADRGGCIDMTVPNRTLEEVSFHTVVRTTQPEIKGVTLPNPNPVPADLIRRIADLAGQSLPRSCFRQPASSDAASPCQRCNVRARATLPTPLISKTHRPSTNNWPSRCSGRAPPSDCSRSSCMPACWLI